LCAWVRRCQRRWGSGVDCHPRSGAGRLNRPGGRLRTRVGDPVGGMLSCVEMSEVCPKVLQRPAEARR
jgi:hypothetical protein